MMKISRLAIGCALVGWLSIAPPARAQINDEAIITVEVEPVLHEDSGCGGFLDDLTTEDTFARIPNVSSTDAINGIPGFIRHGDDGIGSPPQPQTLGDPRPFWAGNLPKMTDGLWSTGNDDDDNVWNMAQNPLDIGGAPPVTPRLVQWDLGSVQPVTEINAYTRHCTTRSAQIHVIYGSEAEVAPDVDIAGGDDPQLEDLGWTFIALVDSQVAPEFDPDDPEFEAGFANPGNYDGFTGSSVQDDAGGSLGDFRYLLFHLLSVGDQEEAYAEFDVVTMVPPVTADLNMDGFVDGLDLGILLGNFNQCGVPASGGELNGTDPVDGLDLGVLLGAWNPPALGGVAAAAIPEPGSLLLSSLAMLALGDVRLPKATLRPPGGGTTRLYAATLSCLSWKGRDLLLT